ncbi:MAG: sulfotransferase domain-containing protein, partial [Pseudomonadota bacterium]
SVTNPGGTMTKSIVWLASYPKSGNTWTRIFLANYLFNAPSPLNINKVTALGLGDSVRQAYEKVLGQKFPVGREGASVPYRTRLFASIVANKADMNFMKTHNFNENVFGIQLIPDKYTKSAVYIMRNPLDMVISYAKQYSIPVDAAANLIGQSGNYSQGDDETIEQFFGSWSQHVRSWTRKHDYPVCVLQYEHMLADPHGQFRKVLDLLGVPIDEERLDRAVRFSSFDEVSKQEKNIGFIEKPKESDQLFFGRGQSGHWRDELGADVVKRIRTDHKAVMKQYGYW